VSVVIHPSAFHGLLPLPLTGRIPSIFCSGSSSSSIDTTQKTHSIFISSLHKYNPSRKKKEKKSKKKAKEDFCSSFRPSKKQKQKKSSERIQKQK